MKKAYIVKALCASFVAVSLLAGAVSCKNSEDYVFTEDNGIPLSKITLSSTNISLIGSRDITSATITATTTPSFATETTVYWSSSDESIVSVSAESGSSVVVTLKNSGNAVVTAANATGTVKATCNVVCSMEKTPPVDVTNIAATAHGNNVFFTWTDPEDYDEDFAYIVIDSGNGQSTKVPAGVEYGWVSGLTKGTDYNFIFTSYDTSENASSGEKKAVTTLDTVTEFTATEVTAPVIGEKTAEGFTLSWAAGSVLPASEAWNHMVVEVAGKEELNKTLLYTDTAISLPFSGLEENETYTVSVTVYNDDFDTLVWKENISTESYAAVLAYDDAVTETLSGYIPVKVSDISTSISYNKIEFVINDADNITTTAKSAEWKGLDLEKSYTIYAKFLDGSTLVGSSNSITVKPTKVVLKIISGYGNRQVVHAANGDGSENAHVAALNESWYAGWWIITPALNGDADYFSLISCFENGTSTGKYMWLDPNSAYEPAYTGAWSYGGHQAPYAVMAEVDSITNTNAASFKWGTSTHNDSWNNMESASGLRVTHASLTYWGKSTTTDDGDGCGDFKYTVSYVK